MVETPVCHPRQSAVRISDRFRAGLSQDGKRGVRPLRIVLYVLPVYTDHILATGSAAICLL